MLLAIFIVISTIAATPDPWSLMAQRDLEAMRAEILANHPGPADPLNRNFKEWLDKGFEASMAKARAVTTFGGYVYALRHYGAGFRDGHLNSGVTVTRSEFAWPGFLIDLRNGKYVVSAVADQADASLPPAGSELVDCDGRTPRTILEEDIWPYSMGAKIESRWVVVANGLLIDRGNPWAARPKECRFKLGDKIETRALRYRNTTQEAVNKVAATGAATLAPEPPARKSGDGVWVSIPTFSAGNETVLGNLKQQIALAPEWRSAKFVVFDVRGNGGGNSSWGDQILDALYGKEFLDRTVRPKFDAQYVEWRVSKDNVEHLHAIVRQIKGEQGPDAPAVKHFQAVADGMAAALARGESLYRTPEEPAAEPDKSPVPHPLFTGKVFLLTDATCASACLDFADEVRLLPNVTHAGLATSADSVYMEVRPVNLPSGIGRVALPVKVYRDRPRGHNEPYVPQAPYSGDINDTRAVEGWVHRLLGCWVAGLLSGRTQEPSNQATSATPTAPTSCTHPVHANTKTAERAPGRAARGTDPSACGCTVGRRARKDSSSISAHHC